MRKALKIVAISLLAGFVIIQFFRIDQTNPPINEGETLEAAVSVPADVSQIIARSCNDCHSHKTAYPWYINIQPNGWFMKDHVDHGRSHLNFSVFNTYSKQKKGKVLDEICEQVESREMPLPSYLWLHREAILSESDRLTLCSWAQQENQKLQTSDSDAENGT
jgi:hypothetical protein